MASLSGAPTVGPSIAFVIPCYNEEQGIAGVVCEALSIVPHSRIIVCDNNSSDNTSCCASEAGAEVIFEPIRGKGNAVRRLLRDVDADIFVMVDGDGTYDLSCLHDAIKFAWENSFDLLTGDRFSNGSSSSFRKGHGLGNVAFNKLFQIIFGIRTRDVFSGLRIFSRRMVKSFPLVSAEFEIETELTIYAARMRLPMADFPTSVGARLGSESKLNTWRDGFKILAFSVRLLHREYPLRLYAALAILALGFGLFAFFGVYAEFLVTGLVPRIPTLISSTFLILLAIILLVSGLILKEVSNVKYEARYLTYLGLSS